MMSDINVTFENEFEVDSYISRTQVKGSFHTTLSDLIVYVLRAVSSELLYLNSA